MGKMTPCPCEGDETSTARHYKIVRHVFNGERRVVKSGLTLAEAKAHCQDPETSSSTATKAEGRRRTQRLGRWFDGYAHV